MDLVIRRATAEADRRELVVLQNIEGNNDVLGGVVDCDSAEIGNAGPE